MNNGKILVAVLAMLMIVAGVTVVLSDDSSAVETPTPGTTVSDLEGLEAAIAGDQYDVIGLSGGFSIDAGTTLDLDGKTIVIMNPVTNTGTFALNGGTIQNGTIDANNGNAVLAYSGTISNVNFQNFNIAITNQINSMGDVVISGCNFTALDSGSTCSAIYVNMDSNGSLNVDSCQFNGTYSEQALNLALYTNDVKPKVSVTNCNISVHVWGPQAGYDGELDIGTDLDLGDNTTVTTYEMQKSNGADKNVVTNIPDGESFSPQEVVGDSAESSIVVKEGGNYYGPNSDLVTNENPNTGDRMPLSQSIIAVYDELRISGEAYISGTDSTLVIPEGKTLRIMSGGNLDMARNTLIVEGTLIVETGATVSNGGTITLVRGSTFDNSGTIGVGAATEISADTTGLSGLTYDGKGSVSVSNVSGMTFGFVNVTTSSDYKPQYMLTVSGDLIAEDADSNNISIDGARIVDDLYVGQDVELSIVDSEVRNGSTITVDGTLASNGNLTMYNGSEIIVNGQIVGDVKAVTGEYLTRDGENGFLGSSYTTPKQSTFGISANGGFVTGYTLSVGTYAYQKTLTDGTVESWTSQRLYISGSLSYGADYTATTVPTTGTMVLTGSNGIYVNSDVTVVLPNGLQISNSGSPINALGTVQITGATTVPGFDYIGSSYVVKTTGTPSTSTGYITTFDAAMNAISTADQQKITVKGDLDIDSAYTLGANQRLDLSSAGDVVVKVNGSLTLEARSIVTGNIDNVEGVMTIMKPNGSAAPLKYSTIAEGTTDGVSYTRYSGLQYALDNANDGDTITVVGETEIDGNLTIPSGVTVSAENKISVSGNLVIEENAKLEIIDDNILDMTGQKSKVTVNGTLDLTEGTISFTYKSNNAQAETDTALTSTTGKTLWSLTQDIEGDDLPDAFNTVAYIDENNQIIMTSPSAAIQAAAAQDINKYVVVSGNVTGGDIDLTVDMLVRMDANATFGTITLSEGVSVVVNANGKLTANITAQTGVEDSEAPSTVQLKSVGNIAVGETHVTDGQNVTTHQLFIAGAPIGEIEVSAGTAVAGTSLTQIQGISGNFNSLVVNKTGTSNTSLTVASGATLVVNDRMTLESGKTGANNSSPAVVIDGTLSISECGIVNITGIMDINGQMTVADGNTEGVTVSSSGTMNVTGTLSISTTEDEEAAIEVSGTLVVGEKITTMGGSSSGVVTGIVNFGASSGTVKVYNGASVEDAIIGGDSNADGISDAANTAFYINGNLYMTVYAVANTDIDPSEEDISIVGYDMKVENAYDINEITSWYTDAEMTQHAENATVGNPDALYFKVNASNVDVRISVGQGISLYIDNIRYDSGETVSLSVGTHSVSASVNPGFTGDVTVQFNGQTITNGQFTITPEMASNTYEGSLTLTATGNITQDSTVVVNGGSSDDGMSLTDILLIILVILIVVMAIIVALRLMRS